MKKKLYSLVSHMLTVFIVVQALLCFVLLFRTAVDKDMAILGFRFYYIVSPSMEPVIETGAEIVVKDVPTDKLEVGDIITFASRDPAIAGYPNTHRIMEILVGQDGNRTFVTKGDNNPSPDPYPVFPEDIYGKVVLITPSLKGLLMFYSFAATPTGFVVVIVMPLLLVFGIFLRSFVREFKNGVMEAAEAEERAQDPEALIAMLVKEHMETNPDKELSAEEAAKLAGEMLEKLKSTEKE